MVFEIGWINKPIYNHSYLENVDRLHPNNKDIKIFDFRKFVWWIKLIYKKALY